MSSIEEVLEILWSLRCWNPGLAPRGGLAMASYMARLNRIEKLEEALRAHGVSEDVIKEVVKLAWKGYIGEAVRLLRRVLS